MSLDHLAHLRNESDRFLSVLRGAAPDASVPSCPEWAADDLLWHLAEVQWFWGEIVERRLDDPDAAEEAKPERPDSHDGLIELFESAHDRLVRTLTETPPTTEVWMWGADKSVAYIRRRQAQEALIHRLDAELTVGDVTPLDAALASDGVHEAFTVMFGGVPSWGAFTDSGRRVAIEATDTGLVIPLMIGRWAGTSPNTGTSYDEECCEPAAGPVTPDAVVRGTAEDLDAWAWGRRSADALTVEGDPAVFEALEEVVRPGIQ